MHQYQHSAKSSPPRVQHLDALKYAAKDDHFNNQYQQLILLSDSLPVQIETAKYQSPPNEDFDGSSQMFHRNYRTELYYFFEALFCGFLSFLFFPFLCGRTDLRDWNNSSSG